ncbi:hypothetical protein DH2020_021200 [Rehmannia glutinosa]|uniref:DUF4283 domain-containing protein n=1 Tax=Rehmannia glutinosa TaxID=99300 RepID=A0ABR0WB60_REHGL
MDDPVLLLQDGHDASDNPPPKSYANVLWFFFEQINLSFDPKNIIPMALLKMKKNEKVLRFSSSETDRLDATWRLTPIGKFSFAIPRGTHNRQWSILFGNQGPFSWSFANQSHIIIKLDWKKTTIVFGRDDLVRRGVIPMRILKWTPSFNPKMEAPLALFGSNFRFAYSVFDYHALFAIAKVLGDPFKWILQRLVKQGLLLLEFASSES